MTDLLVTGASGHFGQLVLGHLLDTLDVPAQRIVATSRNTGKLGALADRGVIVRPADFDEPSSLTDAFQGARRLLLISTDSLDGAGTRLRQHRNAVAAAGKAGVGHILYTSLPKAETSHVSFAPDHLGTERAIASSGIAGWSILRNNWYAENLLMSLPQALKSGQWYSAAGQGRIAYAARSDLALAAAAALAGDFDGQRTLTLSGTGSYTAEEIASAVSNATGKPLAVVHVPVEGLVQGMIGAGLPEPAARTIASFDDAAAHGDLDVVTNDLETLTGRKPQPLMDWIAANATRF